VNVSPAYNRLGLSAAYQDDRRSEHRDGDSEDEDSDDPFDAEMGDDARSKFMQSRANKSVKLRAKKRKYVVTVSTFPCPNLFTTSRAHLANPFSTQSGAESGSESSVYHGGSMYAAVSDDSD
jgi:hypothetical protein